MPNRPKLIRARIFALSPSRLTMTPSPNFLDHRLTDLPLAAFAKRTGKRFIGNSRLAKLRNRLFPDTGIDRLFSGSQPFQVFFRQFTQKPGRNVITHMSMQHPCLRITQIKPFSGPGNGNIHQAPFFFESAIFLHAVFMWEKTFFQTGNENGIEFKSFGRVNRHQLEGILSFVSLVLPRFERGVCQKSGKWRHNHGQRNIRLNDTIDCQ